MKYIIDTDPGIDDAIAICMAIKNKLDVIGFTISDGNMPVSQCENNLMIIEDFLETNIPIFKCKKEKKRHNKTAEFAHGLDGLGYAVFPKQKTRRTEKMTAERFISKACKHHKDDIGIICLGSLTNLASAIKKDPSIVGKVKKLIIMGASYNPRAKKPYLEYNIKLDIPSAQFVLSKPFKDVEIITHEIGVKAFMEKDEIVNLRDSKDLISRFIALISQKRIEFCMKHYGTEGLDMPDPATIASVINQDIIKYKRADVTITNEGETQVVLNENSNIKIAHELDIEKLRTLFRRTFK